MLILSHDGLCHCWCLVALPAGVHIARGLSGEQRKAWEVQKPCPCCSTGLTDANMTGKRELLVLPASSSKAVSGLSSKTCCLGIRLSYTPLVPQTANGVLWQVWAHLHRLAQGQEVRFEVQQPMAFVVQVDCQLQAAFMHGSMLTS